MNTNSVRCTSAANVAFGKDLDIFLLETFLLTELMLLIVDSIYYYYHYCYYAIISSDIALISIITMLLL
jgi:hypothetical protein